VRLRRAAYRDRGTARGLARFPLLVLLGLAVAGCALFDEPPRDHTITSIEACLIPPSEGRGLVGAYLRQADGTPKFDVFSVRGSLRRNGRPDEVSFNQDSVNWWRARPDGGVGLLRRSSAAPRPGFGTGEAVPGVFDFTYLADGSGGATFSGPMVLGPGPSAADMPTTGGRVFTGTIELALNRSDGSGGFVTTRAEGRFDANIGYGSGRSSFDATGFSVSEGPALPFTLLNWSGLGACGPRIVSSGQGSVKVLTEDGSVISPFSKGRSPEKLRSSFEAAQFDGPEGSGPPEGLGGVFLIESDAGTLSGVFLSGAGGS